MSNIKPTKAQMFNGLRRRPQYEEISNEINPDKTKVIYPNRDAKFLREDPRMTQLDGLGFFESMQEQQESINKEQRKETIMQEIARDSGTGVKEVKAKGPPKKTEVFNMAAGDDDDGDAPMPGHEQTIMEARNMTKQKRRTKAEMTAARMAEEMAKLKNRTQELMELERQQEKAKELDKRRTVPPPPSPTPEDAQPEPPKPKSRGRPTKKDKPNKEPAKKTKEEIKKEEIKEEIKE